MPVPNAMERQIKIHRDSNMGTSALTPHQVITPGGVAQQQQETRTWRQETYSTKKVVQGSTEPTVIQQSSTTKSQDLFSNKHSNEDRRGSNCSTTSNTSNTNKTSNLKSSTLVSKALQEFEDDFNNHVQDVRRNSKTTTTTTTQQQQQHSLMPMSTPTMEIVPSGSRSASPNWSMGTDAQGDVPLTYEIVTKVDGTKEFQLLLTAREFSPEDLQVKLVENTLTISGNHEERSPNGAYKQKSFSRTCTIPSGVRPEDLNCSLDSCGRLKITAPVPDLEPLTSSQQKSIKTISTQNNSLMNQNWENNGTSENIMNVFDDNTNMMGNEAVKQHSTKTVTKTVKTFKSVA